MQKRSSFDNFESAVYSASVSMPLTNETDKYIGLLCTVTGVLQRNTKAVPLHGVAEMMYAVGQ